MHYRVFLALMCLEIALQVPHSTALEYGAPCSPIRRPGNALGGQCLPLRSCRNLFAILLRLQSGQLTTSDSDTQMLRDSSCGKQQHALNEHLICCPVDEIQLNSHGVGLLQRNMNNNFGGCGPFRTNKVAHGQDAGLSQFPWMALLKYTDGKFRCGGSLITDQFVLTAAHCVVGNNLQPIEVRLGEHDISQELDCARRGRGQVCSPPVEDVRISKIISHERYSRITGANDIALIRLERIVEFKKHILPICLATTPTMRAQSRNDYLVSGWGLTETGESSNVLQYVAVPFVDRASCETAMGSRAGQLNEGELCAGGKRMQDSCKGDSGGPLSQVDIFENYARMVQYGVVSRGVVSCGELSIPGVYTNVSHYTQWISDNMW